MTLFGDFYFFEWAAVLLLPAVVLGVMEKPIKYYGFAATLFFIYMAMRDRPEGILYLAVYCLLELTLVKVYLKITAAKGRNPRIYWTFLLLSLAPLIAFKLSGYLGNSLFAFIGISYMTFKSVQMIIEIYDGIIKECNTFEFLYFLIFFPCLSSGPIDRSRRFHEDFTGPKSRQAYLEMAGSGLFKICLGLAYKFAFAMVFYKILTQLGMDGTLQSDLIYMYTYGFYLFFDFAGYSLMAVGMSYLFGIASPDNFNRPFVSLDMKEFWDRWHISLSHWFRDFIFSRFMMKAIRGKWFASKLTGASFGFIINMFVMGVWHGLDIYYLIYGLYHGVLLAATEVYQKKSKFHKKHKKERWYRMISWFITFNLVMFGFFIFSGRFTDLVGLS